MFDDLLNIFLIVVGLLVVVSYGINKYFHEKRKNLQSLLNPDSKKSKGE